MSRLHSYQTLEILRYLRATYPANYKYVRLNKNRVPLQDDGSKLPFVGRDNQVRQIFEGLSKRYDARKKAAERAQQREKVKTPNDEGPGSPRVKRLQDLEEEMLEEAKLFNVPVESLYTESHSKNNPQVCFSGPPGSGKSRLADEISGFSSKMLTEHCKNKDMKAIFENSISIEITFNGGAPYTSEEEAVSEEISIGVRMLHMYGRQGLIL